MGSPRGSIADGSTYSSSRRTPKVRVLTMIDCMMTSGAEIAATQIALALDQDRFESTICSTRSSAPEHVEFAESHGVKVLELNRRSKLDLSRWSPLLQRLRHDVDVVHAHKFGSNLWASLIAPLVDVPVLIAHEHTWSFDGKPLRRLVDRRLIAGAADVVLAVSEQDRTKMIELEGIPPEKVRFVPNGIPDVRQGDRLAGRQLLGLAPEARVAGTICALRPQKAVEVALEGFAEAAGDSDDVFVVVGDGPERERLEVRARALLGARAIFVGRRAHDEVPDLIAALDVLVLSSSFEGMPLSVLEWMAAGKPIVATRVGGVPALIRDGVEGLLVPPSDPPAIAEALRCLWADPVLAARLGSAARARQRAEFRLRNTVVLLEDLYESLYRSSGRSRPAPAAKAHVGR